MPRFSVIIPVYNRPYELAELLETLNNQSFKDFEVLIIEDGSVNRADEIVEKWKSSLDIRYFYKENTGQGFSRNFGFSKARGDFFLVFDSDCLVPEHYLEVVDEHLAAKPLDAWGGPDRAHSAFTPLQKAISYSMTSLFTTGGIRGRKKRIGAFHPRSFNMGISREVWQKTGGYVITRMGEDIEFSIRIIEAGFKTGLIEEAYVYHKRRTSLTQFYDQLHFFGRARINISRFFPGELRPVHAFPAAFVAGLIIYLILPVVSLKLFCITTIFLVFYFVLIFVDATFENHSIRVGILSMAASFVQLWAYGIGFWQELIKKLREDGKIR